jgi:hypothetical protein
LRVERNEEKFNRLEFESDENRCRDVAIDCVTGTTKGKNFWCSQLACWSVTLLIKLTFFPLLLHAGEYKVNFLYSSIKLVNQ